MNEITKRIAVFNEQRISEMVAVKYKLMQDNMFRFSEPATFFIRIWLRRRLSPLLPIGLRPKKISIPHYMAYRGIVSL
jgi:hypothetical protein